MLDGKIRILVVRNAAGNIVARSLLRVLHDKERDEAVLVMDKVYVATGYAVGEAKEILEVMAMRKAQQMGVTVLSSIAVEGERYPNPVISYGGPVQDEYVDILGNRAQNTNFYAVEANRLVVLREASPQINQYQQETRLTA